MSQITYPHYEIVIRYPDGVAYASREKAGTETEARGKALASFRQSKAFAHGAGQITVEANWRQSSADASILLDGVAK